MKNYNDYYKNFIIDNMVKKTKEENKNQQIEALKQQENMLQEQRQAQTTEKPKELKNVIKIIVA